MFSKTSLIIVLITISMMVAPVMTCLQSFEYQDTNGVCQPCYYRCQSCQDNTTYCISCIAEYYLDPIMETC
jgi:hypothetical protein